VWWDPDVLILDPPELTGLRRERILVEDEGGRAARESSTNHAAWSDARDAAIASGARPSRLVRTPTDLGALAVPPTGPPLEVPGGREPGDAPDTADAAVLRELADINAAITVATTTRALSRRASTRRLGTLVHEVLRDVAFGASSAAVAASVSWHGRRMGASDEERAQASEAVAAALDHPLLRAAATSSQCRREVDLSITVLAWHIEGVADLAFMTDEGWTVVDFKTGLPTEASLRAYRIQVACYAAAIARATGQPTRGVLLLV
jgi:hypothetical protein